MTFASTETSIASGAPVELYKISYTGNTWSYCTAEEPVVFGGLTYTPMAIERDEIKSTTDTAKADITFRTPITAAIGEIFRVQPPSEVVVLEIYQKHYGFPEDEWALSWKGRITDASWEGPEIVYSTSSIFASLRRAGLRSRWQKPCPYVLYGSECKVSAALFAEFTECGGISGLDVIALGAIGQPDSKYAGGYITWTHNQSGNIEQRGIRSSVGGTGALRLGSLPRGLLPGQAITIYPGCDHTMGSNGCKRFANSLNYGGKTVFRPAQNPFAGSNVW